MRIRRGKNARGFRVLTFADQYGSPCRIQKSSLATKAAIWFGVTDANPQVMVAEAAGIGWVPYPIPPNVLLTTEMHLTRDQVRKLLPILQHFVDTGELP